MRWLFLFALMGFTFSAFSNQSQLVEGKGSFLSVEDDSVSFVKGQLLRNAFDEIIKRDLTATGLDQQLFYDRYNQKFDEYFLPTEAKLREKYKIRADDNGLANAEFQKELRSTRLTLRAKFGNLESAISSYSVIEYGSSPEIPSNKFMTVSAKVDRKQLGAIYSKFTRDVSGRLITAIYLDASFALDDMNWKDVGVILEEDFTTVVKEHWHKILAEKLAPLITNFVIVNPTQRERIKKLISGGPFTYDSIASTEFGEFKDVALLKLQIRMKKISDEPLLDIRTFQIDGGFILQDLLTRKVLAEYDFNTDKHRIVFKNDHDLSSNLATAIYQKPLEELLALKNRLPHFKINDSKSSLIVRSVRSIKDVIDISRRLSMNGSSLDLTATIKRIEGSIAYLDLDYTGKRDALISVLKTLDDGPLPSGNGIKLSEESIFDIEIKQMEKMEAP